MPSDAVTRRFRLRSEISDGATYWTQVVVYDDLDSMRRAAAKHSRQPLSDFADTGGMLQYDSEKDGTYIGILRLCTKSLSASVIAHEAVHVAVRIAHLHYGCDPLRIQRGGSGDREEFLAYGVQYVTEALLDAVS